MKYCFFLLLILTGIGCDSKSGLEKEIEAIPLDITIERFDKIFGAASVSDLPKLKQDFPIFFPEQFADSIWIARINDTLQQQLHEEVNKEFPNELELVEDLMSLFQHIKYYFPQFKTPIVFTTTSDVDYKNKVILTGDLLIISLDTYLGESHPFYEGIQQYLVKNFRASQIIPDVANEYAGQMVSPPRQRSLLAQMLYYGKLLYLKDLWLPEVPDAEKIGYTEEEINWAHENEIDMWRYFVENELLYSTDAKLQPRFINPAPFSKFYLEIDNESPGMIGRYLGWQIVKSYMENNSTSIQQMLILDTDELFNNSKYKPKK
jgi:gliding motility-associated lipoprotein GldB